MSTCAYSTHFVYLHSARTESLSNTFKNIHSCGLHNLLCFYPLIGRFLPPPLAWTSRRPGCPRKEMGTIQVGGHRSGRFNNKYNCNMQTITTTPATATTTGQIYTPNMYKKNTTNVKAGPNSIYLVFQP